MMKPESEHWEIMANEHEPEKDKDEESGLWIVEEDDFTYIEVAVT
jgi:hypothetical protein